MTSELERAAQRHAAAIEESGRKSEGSVISNARLQAQQDMPSWERRIRRRIKEYSSYMFVYVSDNTKDDDYDAWFWQRSCIDPFRFCNDSERNEYVAELQRLLGDTFKVVGNGYKHGTVITSDLPYPHRDIVELPSVTVWWGPGRFYA